MTKGKDPEAPRGQPQKMSAEARFLVTMAADLVAWRVRLKTASREADYLFFLGIFWAFWVWGIYSLEL